MRSVTGELPEDPQVIVDKLHELADHHNIEFKGDIESGYAKGKGFNIEYVVNSTQCTLTVTKKPLLIPWCLVENQLEKLFNR